MSEARITMTAGSIRRLSLAALSAYVADSDVCRHVVDVLIECEAVECRSHGLLRLPEYIGDIRAGRLDPNGRPQISRLNESAYRVDGRRCFGVLAADAVSDTLIMGLSASKLITVAMTNCNHIGRLEHIVRRPAHSGYIVIGFCNSLGAGQKVSPPGGQDGRLCTNPMVFGAPRKGSPPLILDMTTSAVAEGKVRDVYLAGQSVPPGWLVDDQNRDVTDPKRLYMQPPTAFLAPLGGQVFGYKGFGLALFTEILAGVLTGAGFCGPQPAIGGNGGFFIGIDPTLFGLSAETVASNVDHLCRHIQNSGREIRLPGQTSFSKPVQDERNLSVSRMVMEAIQHAAG